jgi:hypothetical protein
VTSAPHSIQGACGAEAQQQQAERDGLVQGLCLGEEQAHKADPGCRRPAASLRGPCPADAEDSLQTSVREKQALPQAAARRTTAADSETQQTTTNLTWPMQRVRLSPPPQSSRGLSVRRAGKKRSRRNESTCVGRPSGSVSGHSSDAAQRLRQQAQYRCAVVESRRRGAAPTLLLKYRLSLRGLSPRAAISACSQLPCPAAWPHCLLATRAL